MLLMASRLRTWVRRVTPPTTRALARRVATGLLDRVTHGAEQLADVLRPALPAAQGQASATITVRPAAPAPTPEPVSPVDVGWALARHVSTAFEAQTQALCAEGPGRGTHHPETIRKMRIASRRLRAAVKLFAPWLDKKLRRSLLADLKAITRALGPLRDLDVVSESLAISGDDDETQRLRRAAMELLRARICEPHARVRKRADKALRSIDRDHLRARLTEAKRHVVERLTDDDDVRHQIAALLERTVTSAFSKTPVPATLEDREAVHDVRILAKRLRYAYAWTTPALSNGPGPRRLLKRAQRAVGASRDLDLLIAELDAHAEDLRAQGHGVLADALAAWRAETAEQRERADQKILPALADLDERTVLRLTLDALALDR